jgi:hypothetical protein
VLGEDVQDQRRPVDDLDLDDGLELAELPRRQLAVAHDRVRALGDDDVAQLTGLARAHERGRVGLVPALHHPRQHLRPGGLGQRGQLGERALGLLDGAVGPDADQHDALEAQLAVLDLGDVLQLGR